MAMITNVVCLADLNCNIDLVTLVNRTINAIYDPSRYSGILWKHPEIGGHCNVFSSGKIMTNGKADCVKDGIKRLRRYARRIQRYGWTVRLSTIRVVTVSASYKLDGPLDLRCVNSRYGGHYEPELFPGATFTRDNVHFTCFHTGSVLMTGIKQESQLISTVGPILIEMSLL